jgi:hypothetical protein
MDKRKVAIIKPTSEGVYYHRFLTPFALMQDVDVTVINGFHNDNCRPDMFDVIIFSRGINQELAWLDYAKQKGVKIIVDIDDAIDLHFRHPKFNHLYTPVSSDHIKKCIGYADDIWASNEHILGAYGFQGKAVPNALNYEDEQWNIPKQPSTLLGGVFGDSRAFDLYEFRNIYPDAALLGCTNLREHYKNIYNPLKYYEYGYFYSNIKIAFSYLSEKIGLFNDLKSNLKMLEAGAYDLPFIASDRLPYAMLPKQGGYLCSNKSEWLNAIKKLRNDTRRQDMGSYLGEWTRKNYNIHTINQTRYESINS